MKLRTEMWKKPRAEMLVNSYWRMLTAAVVNTGIGIAINSKAITIINIAIAIMTTIPILSYNKHKRGREDGNEENKGNA